MAQKVTTDNGLNSGEFSFLLGRLAAATDLITGLPLVAMERYARDEMAENDNILHAITAGQFFVSAFHSPTKTRDHDES